MPDRGRVIPLTQKQRILSVLRDGGWHTATELYRTGCVLHSRISDLRKDGHLIERRHVGGIGTEAHEYRLVPSETPMGAPEDGAAATSGGTAAPESATLGVSLDTTGQLTLVGEPFRKRQRAA